MSRLGAIGCCLLLLLELVSPQFVRSCTAEADLIAETIAQIEQVQCKGDLQHWLDTTLSESAGEGSAEWYAIALAKTNASLDYTCYLEHLSAAALHAQSMAATSRQRCALTIVALSVQQYPSICTEILDLTAGQQGIMSWVFALHLLNNGVSSRIWTASDVIQELLNLQCADGGWALRGTRGDVDVTAMTLQALAPYYTQSQNISDAVSRAISMLSERQMISGGYQSYGAENPESAAQVWIALSCLGIDALSDVRFSKNGRTVWSSIASFMVAPGAYAHLQGGGENASATVQVYLALQAHWCYQNHRNSIYLFRDDVPHIEDTASIVTTTALTSDPWKDTPRSTTTTCIETHTSSDVGMSMDVTLMDASTSTVSTTNLLSTITLSTLSGQSLAEYGDDSKTTTQSTIQTSERPATCATPSSTRRFGTLQLRFLLSGIVVLVVLAMFLCYWLRGHRRKCIAWLFVGLLAGGLCVVWIVPMQTPQEYYQATDSKPNAIGTVTLSISCETILGKDGSALYPADGILLAASTYEIAAGDTVLTILNEAARANALQLEVDGISGTAIETAYVRGICNLYEFDFGSLSGWTYEVNGIRPAMGAGAYALMDGDVITWRYTCDLGDDLMHP